jgi:hypothetical protein
MCAFLCLLLLFGFFGKIRVTQKHVYFDTMEEGVWCLRAFIQALKLCVDLDMDMDLHVCVCVADPLPIHTVYQGTGRVDSEDPN